MHPYRKSMHEIVKHSLWWSFYLDPLLLLNFTFVCLRFKTFASILLIFTDTFIMVLVVITPVQQDKLYVQRENIRLAVKANITTNANVCSRRITRFSVLTRSLFHSQCTIGPGSSDKYLHDFQPELFSGIRHRRYRWRKPFSKYTWELKQHWSARESHDKKLVKRSHLNIELSFLQ